MEDMEITPEDCKISENDFDTSYAKYLREDPEMMKAFKKRIVADFNRTGNMAIFLNNLKILAMAGNVAGLAREAGIKRPNIYKALSRTNNPSFATVRKIAALLGINIRMSVARG